MHYYRRRRHGDTNAKLTNWGVPPEERFWAKVDKNGPVPAARPDLGPCWLWTASTRWGFGMFKWSETDTKGTRAAHRLAYELLVGPIPDDLTLDHLCCVAACVNPEHLEPVPFEENRRRADEKWTVCKRGHVLSPDNVDVNQKTGRRRCSTCRRELRRKPTT